MAGAGVRVFQPGEVLTAALVNTYLQDQVVCRFDDATDRDDSFGGSGQPILEEGRICYLDSTNELQYFDGTVWVTISPEAITGVITAKGDLVVGTAPNTVARLAIGANGRVLTADSTTSTGVAWVVPSVPDGSITEAKLNDEAVTTSKIADNAITSDKIAPGTVIAADIAAGTITVTELADGAVTSAKILDGTIVNTDVSASAAIAYGKLNLANSIATTDLASGAPRAGFRSTQNAQTGTTYTLSLSDLGALVELSNASPITLTVPLESSVAFTVGDRVDIVQTGAGQVTVAGAGGVTVNAYDGQLKLNGQWAAATLIKRATNTWLLVGNITS